MCVALNRISAIVFIFLDQCSPFARARHTTSCVNGSHCHSPAHPIFMIEARPIHKFAPLKPYATDPTPGQ